MIHKLNSTNLQEIFLRLPINSLMRCRHVCRSWRELIRGYEFTQIYTSQSLAAKKGLIVQTLYRATSCSELYFIDRRHGPIPTCLPLRLSLLNLNKFTLIGSCNGLLCLACRVDNFTRFICNPFLGEFIEIPRHAYPIGAELISVNCEFGFCLQTQSYKVLEVAKWCAENGKNHWKYWFEVYVHRLGDSYWKPIHSEAYQWLPQWISASLVNGALHWVGWTSARRLCVFDLADDVFKDMRGPKTFASTGNRFTSGVLGNRLSIMNTNSYCVDVWLMKLYGDPASWEKSFVINLIQIDFDMDFVRVIDYQEKDGLFISYDHMFGTYNFERMEFERMGIVGYSGRWFQFVLHCDTIISPFHLQRI